MIEIAHVTKRYGKQTAVSDLSLQIPTGAVFGFLGRNGAGKTTTMKMLVGIAAPDNGSIRIGGKRAHDPDARRGIGFMPEAPYFYDRLTGLEFLHFCAELCGATVPNTQLETLLRDVDIFDARHKPITAYSKGMKQRLGFAQALVHDPAYVFLDEPLDGLDPIGRREIKLMIKKLKARGKTVFFNSHILYDTEELCDLVGVIDRGTLLYAGSVREFCAGKLLEERFVELVQTQTLHA